MSVTAQYALVLDDSYSAIVLRDLFHAKAQEHHTRWSKANTRKAVQQNLYLYEMYRSLAERCEHIRKEEVARISAQLGEDGVRA